MGRACVACIKERLLGKEILEGEILQQAFQVHRRTVPASNQGLDLGPKRYDRPGTGIKQRLDAKPVAHQHKALA